MQTENEILGVYTDWKNYYAPKNLLDNEQTTKLLAEYVAQNYAGVVSRTSLDAAAAALGNQILKPEAPKKTPEQLAVELQAAELKRIKKEALENSVPFDQSAKLAAAKAAEDEVKKQEAAKIVVNNLILDYSVNGLPGRIDHSKTAAGRAALRGIRVNREGKQDWLLTLKVVQAAYNNDTPSEIIRAAEKALERLKETSASVKEQEQQRWGSRPR